MYPIIRVIKELVAHRNAAPIPVTGTHTSTHRCWPQDIDYYFEMNNGRILTLLDLNRTVLAKRTGLLKVLRANNWGLTMAGVSVRYRRRIRPFEKFETKGRALCWDDRFIYLEQVMIKANGETANQALYRSAVTGPNGIVPPALVLQQLGQDTTTSPTPPEWVQNWIDADATRPWPPEILSEL